MSTQETSVAAATAIVGYDLLKDERWQSEGYGRNIVGIGCKGSAAAGDTLVEIYIGTQLIGTIYNTGAGFPNMDDVKPFRAGVPPHEDIHAVVKDAPTTNPINLLFVFQ